MVKEKIENIGTEHLSIQVGHINTSILSQSISLKDVALIDQTGKFDVQLKKIKLTGVHIFELLMHNTIEIGEISIQSPEIKINQQTPQLVASNKKGLRRSFPTLKIHELNVENGTFLLRDSISGADSIFSFLFDAQIKDIDSQSQSGDSLNEIPKFENITINISRLNYKEQSGSYRFTIDQCQLNTSLKQLTINQAECTPILSKYEIGRKTGVETDWFNITIKQIRLNGFKIDNLIRQESLKLQSVQIDQFVGETFIDKRLPSPQKPDSKIPSDLFRLPSIPYSCDSIIINRASIRYSERAENSTEAGFIDFNQINATILNITNNDSLPNLPIKMTAEAKIMNEAILSAEFQFATPGMSHLNTVSGNLKPMRFQSLNSVVKPNMGAQIQSGTINHLDFKFTYDDNHASGKLVMDYEDLKIVFLNQEKKRKKQVESLVANSIIIRSHNIPDQKYYRKGTINFERDKKRSFFSFWWKSVLSGIQSIVVN
ncbi:AsmA family protein [Mangrovibacterium lignilyticum]|uniref:hypothetical protein n=1 Tax=Mangrovibacterium lignilyticum TaxID=2668052 RepID=UPI0013CF9F22|nr:hypothetical protein [Mangrovibacterium lignilyticum]